MKLRIALAVLFFASAARAEEPLPEAKVLTYPPGEDTITVVRKGDAAPYGGQLFDDKTALRWAIWLQQYRTVYGVDLRAERASCAVKIEREAQLRSIEAERNTKSEKDLRDRLSSAEKARYEAEEKLRNPPFWKEPGFWYSAGVLTTVVAVVAVVAAER